MLPARFLTELGIFMQTSAHLELAMWQIIMLADGEVDPKPESLAEYLKVKNVSKKLTANFKKCAAKLEPSLAIRLKKLADEIEEDMPVRNYAAHGAFFLGIPNDELNSQHYFIVDNDGRKEWRQTFGGVTRREIAHGISKMDLRLREAISIRETLQKRLEKS
jgi:hypothetical protein